MRIKSIQIDNFKSMSGFTIELEKFNCIVGLNGSGKSTFLQSVDFIAQLARGDMDSWLSARNWKPNDIKFKLDEKQSGVTKFKVNFLLQTGRELEWSGRYNIENKCCTEESVIETGHDKIGLLKVALRKYSIYSAETDKHVNGLIDFNYTGSIMSQLSDKVLGQCPLLVEIRDFMKNIKSLDLLSPDTLKSACRDMGDIGLGGERFPGFLKTLTTEQHNNILKDIRQFYPNLLNFRVIGQNDGIKKIVFEEQRDGTKTSFDARHVSDGLIRTLAIVAQTQLKRSCVLFDEIENGINPELMEQLVNYLIGCNAQIIITTHNPMILNYIPDEIACRSIDFFYKKCGKTKAVKFLDMPATKEKLNFLTAGEIFVDTDLTDLSKELAERGDCVA